MRSFTTTFSLSVAVIGVMVASMGSAAATAIRVPEPMSALVFGVGLIGAAIIGRRKKK
jgi:hypothetical protein